MRGATGATGDIAACSASPADRVTSPGIRAVPAMAVGSGAAANDVASRAAVQPAWAAPASPPRTAGADAARTTETNSATGTAGAAGRIAGGADATVAAVPVVPSAALDHVVARATEQPAGAATATLCLAPDAQSAGASIERQSGAAGAARAAAARGVATVPAVPVVAVAAADGVVAGTSEQAVVSARSANDLRSGLRGSRRADGIDAVPTGTAGAVCADDARPVATVAVVPGAPVDEVAAIAAIDERIVTGATVQAIVAATAPDHVGPAAAADDVPAGRADQEVGPGRALDGVEASRRGIARVGNRPGVRRGRKRKQPCRRHDNAQPRQGGQARSSATPKEARRQSILPVDQS